MDNRKKENLEAIVENIDIPQETPIEELVEVETPLEEAEPQDNVPEEVEPQKPAPAKKQDVDYKEKYSQSSREASALFFKNQKISQVIEEATKIPEPNEEELRSYAKEQGAEFDELDQFSKNILKKTYLSEKRFQKIEVAHQESKKVDDWVDKVDDFIGSEDAQNKYPSLSTYDDEFRKYCLKEQRRGMDLEDLVASFLFNIEKNPPVQNRKSLFNSRGNGSNTPVVKAKPTSEDAINLRNRNQKEYMRAIKSGKLDIEIE